MIQYRTNKLKAVYRKRTVHTDKPDECSGPVTQAGRQVALILGGKGGGKSGRYQGKGTDYSAEKAREAFEVVLALNKPACQSDVSS